MKVFRSVGLKRWSILVAIAVIPLVVVVAATPWSPFSASPSREATAESQSPPFPDVLRGKVLHITSEVITDIPPTFTQQTREAWYEISTDGHVIRGHSVVTSPDGSLEQRGYYEDGTSYNLQTVSGDVITSRGASEPLHVSDVDARLAEGYQVIGDGGRGSGWTLLERDTSEARGTHYLYEGVRVGLEAIVKLPPPGRAGDIPLSVEVLDAFPNDERFEFPEWIDNSQPVEPN